MTRIVHFIAGLPRSGSTLLAALLRQNPALHAEMSSPVAVACERVLPVMAQGEYASLFTPQQRRDTLTGLLDSYYAALPPETVLFDTNRAWCARLALLEDLYPDAHVVACVRDPVWILDSFETLMRRSPYAISKLHGLQNAGTVFDRVEQLMAPTGAFGAAWQALQEAYYGPRAPRLIVIDYDRLVRAPHDVLARLYALLGLPPFRHDTEAVVYRGGEGVDAALNTPGLHAVRPRVEAIARRTVLPPALVQRLAGKTFWRDPKQNPGGAIIIA